VARAEILAVGNSRSELLIEYGSWVQLRLRLGTLSERNIDGCQGRSAWRGPKFANVNCIGNVLGPTAVQIDLAKTVAAQPAYVVATVANVIDWP
jgi:hypothetical protein